MSRSVFHPDVYRTDRAAPSHWQATAAVRPAPAIEGWRDVEVAIIGGGYAGLSAALHLARDHGIEAALLEAGPIGWGASGRNGGFVTLPSAKLGLSAMIRRFGEAETKAFFAGQMDGIHLVRALLADEAIDADPQGDANYEVAHHPSVTPHLLEAAKAYAGLLGLDASFLPRGAFLDVGHGGREQFGAFRLGGAFGLHPLKYCAGLREAAERHGAAIHGDSRVLSWSRDGNRHRLETRTGGLRARTVILATNAYLADDLSPSFANRTLPALSNIIVTRPLTEAELAAESWRTDCPVSNARDLLFYYRLLPDRRFLFGARGGTSGSATEDMRMKAWLVRRLGEVFPAFGAADIETFWTGLVCLTGRLTPAVGRLSADPSVFYGFGCHGSGVAFATWTGRRLAAAVAEGGTRPIAVPAPIAGLPPNLVSPLVRSAGLKAAYLWYGVKDRLTERAGKSSRD